LVAVFAGEVLAAVFAGEAFLAAAVVLAAALVPVAFLLAVVVVGPVAFLAVVLLVEDDAEAVRFAAVPLADAVVLPVDLVAVALDFFAAVPRPVAALAAVSAVNCNLGSFVAPDTTAFRWAPALNFGTAVFLAFCLTPVRGFLTMRASRMRFSKDPKPVMATFSPLATSRVMVSSTDSRACEAALRFPSKRAARVSTS
jgi:hypothetical protein